MEQNKRDFIILNIGSLVILCPFIISNGIRGILISLAVFTAGKAVEIVTRKITDNKKSYAPSWILLLIPVVLPVELPIYITVVCTMFIIIISMVFIGGGGRTIISIIPLLWIFIALSFPELFIDLNSNVSIWPTVIVGIIFALLRVTDFKSGTLFLLVPLTITLIINKSVGGFFVGNILIGSLIIFPYITESASTAEGRIISGILGGLTYYIIVTFSVNKYGTMYAILLTQVFSPLIDDLVLSIKFKKRTKSV